MVVRRRSRETERRLRKPFGRFRRFVNAVWHKEDDEEVIQDLRDQLERAVKEFNVGDASVILDEPCPYGFIDRVTRPQS